MNKGQPGERESEEDLKGESLIRNGGQVRKLGRDYG